MQAVDGAHVACVEDECTVTAGTREQGPPLGAHDACDLNIIWVMQTQAGMIVADPSNTGAGRTCTARLRNENTCM